MEQLSSLASLFPPMMRKSLISNQITVQMPLSHCSREMFPQIKKNSPEDISPTYSIAHRKWIGLFLKKEKNKILLVSFQFPYRLSTPTLHACVYHLPYRCKTYNYILKSFPDMLGTAIGPAVFLIKDQAQVMPLLFLYSNSRVPKHWVNMIKENKIK